MRRTPCRTDEMVLLYAWSEPGAWDSCALSLDLQRPMGTIAQVILRLQRHGILRRTGDGVGLRLTTLGERKVREEHPEWRRGGQQ